MKFKVGEIVAFLNESGTAKVMEIINNHELIVYDDNGFEYKFNENDLVKIHGDLDENELIIPIENEISEDKFTVQKDISNPQKSYWELDLHIESLSDDVKNLTPFQMKTKQMQSFKNFYKKAQKHQIRKIVVIHGVGEGILKNDIRDYLSQQEHIQFYDADYLAYGKGATEIILLSF